MPIEVRETGNRRARLTGSDPSVRRQYHVFGAASEIEACTELAAWLDTEGLTTISSVTLKDIEADDSSGRDPAGNRVYLCSVSWGAWTQENPETESTDVPEEHEEEWEFGIETATLFVPRSIQKYRPTDATGFAPDIRLIGDRGDGQPPQGVEWPSPIDQFSIPKIYANADISALKALIRNLRGKLNAAEFRGYPAECCRYLGASARARGRDQVRVIHKFEGREEKTIDISGFASIDAAGFDYVWEWSNPEPSNGKSIVAPKMVCVAKVGETANFDALGLTLP